MGLFSNIFGQAKELTKLGNAVANVKNMLDQYEIDPDTTFLLCAAWVCKVGVIDVMARNNWTPNNTVYVPINGHQTKMYMTEVLGITVGRLKSKVSELYDYSEEQLIADILDGGKSFHEIDSQIPQQLRDCIVKGYHIG